jgi:hypothetical protein
MSSSSGHSASNGIAWERMDGVSPVSIARAARASCSLASCSATLAPLLFLAARAHSKGERPAGSRPTRRQTARRLLHSISRSGAIGAATASDREERRAEVVPISDLLADTHSDVSVLEIRRRFWSRLAHGFAFPYLAQGLRLFALMLTR